MTRKTVEQEKLFYTAKELAAIFGRSTRTISRWVQIGKIRQDEVVPGFGRGRGKELQIYSSFLNRYFATGKADFSDCIAQKKTGFDVVKNKLRKHNS